MTLTNKEIKLTCISLWGGSCLLVLFLYFGFGVLRHFFEMSFIVIKNESIKDIMTMLSGFSITMTGFIAAIGAYLLSISHKKSFIRWKVAGYLQVFYHLYLMCVFFLLITFILCIANSIIYSGVMLLKLALSFFAVNVIHIIFLTLIVVGQSRSAEES